MPAKPKLAVGFHVSTSESIDLANDRARDLGCTAFQIFTRNPQGWKFKEISDKTANKFRKKFRKFGFKTCVAHMPYLPNISSPEKVIYNQSVKSLTAELERCTQLGIPYVVTHMGSHRGKGVEKGLKRLTNACNHALSATNDGPILLLENMAGQTNSVGSSFENIQSALDGITERDRIGVCFDTCHAFAAGYDLSSETRVSETLDKLDEIIGFNQLRIVHLNDSKGELGSHLDRHEHLGLGSIGEKGFRTLLKHRSIRGLPLIMETPDDERRDDRDELKMFFQLAK